ncbi:MAG TPA: hypothetical protein VD884_14365 [Ohtaekwangia sp.]|nr:hypothetical protein [Ohtaekwangia sp.]
MKVKKAALIDAFKELDIDIASFESFLKNASTLEKQYIEVAGDTFNRIESLERERGLLQAQLIQFIFESHLHSVNTFPGSNY